MKRRKRMKLLHQGILSSLKEVSTLQGITVPAMNQRRGVTDHREDPLTVVVEVLAGLLAEVAEAPEAVLVAEVPGLQVEVEAAEVDSDTVNIQNKQRKNKNT